MHSIYTKIEEIKVAGAMITETTVKVFIISFKRWILEIRWFLEN